MRDKVDVVTAPLFTPYPTHAPFAHEYCYLSYE